MSSNNLALTEPDTSRHPQPRPQQLIPQHRTSTPASPHLPPQKKMKLPSPSSLNPVSKRPDGATTICGCTPGEWGANICFLSGLYAIFIAFFTALLIVSQKIINGRDTYLRPGNDEFTFGTVEVDE